MEHPCPKCGTPVEDGTPFCPQCNAPLIRVQSSVTSPATPPLPPGTPDEVQPPAEPLGHAAHQQFRTAPPPTTSPQAPTAARRSVLRAALWAGMIAGAGSLVQSLPFIVLCMVAAGGMSIAFYMRREPEKGVTPGQGLRIGALAGVFGFLMNAILSVLGLLSADTRMRLRTEMGAAVQQAVSSSSDPNATAILRRMGDQMNTPAGLATIFVIALAFLGVFFVVFSGLGGAIGASLFGRRNQ